jgi:putative transposase
VVTCNHIHLLVKDTGEDAIARSMQLIAGRSAQQYNRRKQRKGAFWGGSLPCPAIETNAHLQRCLVYIDLNMVRAGVVQDPSEWGHGGYCEIQRPLQRYARDRSGQPEHPMRLLRYRAVAASPSAMGRTSTRRCYAARRAMV